MFVRFVTPYRDEDSHRLEGVFQAVYRLRDEGRLRQGEAKWLEAMRQWFNAHLPVPTRFSLDRGRQAHRRAICWFRADAAEHLGKVRELVALLERHGVPTRRLRTPRPGYIVYEDAFQVAAVPFRDVTA
jgi:hypothetical protein